MDAYEEKMYAFLTEPDNFRGLVKSVELWDMVREQLLVEFWEMVYEELQRLPGKNSDWIIECSEDFSESYSSIFLYKQAWYTEETGVHICVDVTQLVADNPYYGVWIEPQSSLFHTLRIKEALAGSVWIRETGFRQDRNAQWALFKNLDLYNIHEPETLEQLLPTNRESLVKEAANTLYSFALEIEEELTQLAEKFRKKRRS